MGILNVTPDSFSDGGKYLEPNQALERAMQMEEEGADLIDLGGESTRPGALEVEAAEEIRRVIPVIRKIVPRLKIPISIDTQKGAVARVALEEGAALINDVSALSDPEMAPCVAKAKVPVILMHRRGTPQTMQKDLHYDDLMNEIVDFLGARIRFAVETGIDRILIDPGIGFGKSPEASWEILRGVERFRELGFPIVIGASRKSFIRKELGDEPHQILSGSLVAALIALERGARIVRVHDVRETKALIRLVFPQNFG